MRYRANLIFIIYRKLFFIYATFVINRDHIEEYSKRLYKNWNESINLVGFMKENDLNMPKLYGAILSLIFVSHLWDETRKKKRKNVIISVILSVDKISKCLLFIQQQQKINWRSRMIIQALMETVDLIVYFNWIKLTLTNQIRFYCN